MQNTTVLSQFEKKDKNVASFTRYKLSDPLLEFLLKTIAVWKVSAILFNG